MLRPRFSEWAYLGFLGWILLVVILLPDQRLPYLISLLLILGWVINPAGLSVLSDFRLWLVLLVALLTGALWFQQRDAMILGIAWSRSGFWQGVYMALRGLGLILGFNIAASALSVSGWARVFGALGLSGLGFALGVAFNLLPTLRELSETAFHSIRLRGGLRRPWLAMRLFLLTVTANALRYGDEVVKAASLRAFDPPSHPRRVIPLRPFDCALFGVLGAAAVGLLWN